MRTLEKISFEQFKIDIKDDLDLYYEYLIPSRSTVRSAGYDFKAIEDILIKPGEIKKIPTGIKVSMNEDEMFLIVVRSGMGFKYNIRMCNQVGVIDADYYNNLNNEGHIWVALKNEGEKDFFVKKGEAYCQGIYTKYYTSDNEENITEQRTGGLGSTNKEEKNGK